MSGGFAYVLDVDGEFARRCNTSMVDLEPLVPESEDEVSVKRLIENHARYTIPKEPRRSWRSGANTAPLREDFPEGIRARWPRWRTEEGGRLGGEMSG